VAPGIAVIRDHSGWVRFATESDAAGWIKENQSRNQKGELNARHILTAIVQISALAEFY
jgi:hypothetical protein